MSNVRTEAVPRDQDCIGHGAMGANGDLSIVPTETRPTKSFCAKSWSRRTFTNVD